MWQSIKEMGLLTKVIYCFFKRYAQKIACISQGKLTAIYKNPKGLFLVHIPLFCGPVEIVGVGTRGTLLLMVI